MIRKTLAVFMLLLSLSLFAADSATFVNLGFSADSRFFLFGQYGVLPSGSLPYGELYLVDVARNVFADRGVMRKTWTEQVHPGNIGHGAVYELVREHASIISTHRIEHTRGGRLLYVLLNGEKPKDSLNFRDFNNSRTVNVRLNQSAFGSGKNASSSFYLDLDVSFEDGVRRNFTVGLPDFRRDGVVRYRIKKVLYTPDEKSLVFVIERDELAEGGVNIRYMVETVKLF